ncbi:hypothetical protein NC652_034574 [Populus alba x Populus x berolinensis]|nr:hypothetical protein NC652_034574 [Populus alba x Populus x berolinensis]
METRLLSTSTGSICGQTEHIKLRRALEMEWIVLDGKERFSGREFSQKRKEKSGFCLVISRKLLYVLFLKPEWKIMRHCHVTRDDTDSNKFQRDDASKQETY